MRSGIWTSWIAPAIVMLLAFVLAELGAALVRRSALKRLEGLRAAHWTEQAHVFSEANAVVRLFRVYLISMTTMMLLFLAPDANAQHVLRFCAFAILLAVLVGDPFSRRWVTRATASQLSAPSWRQLQRFGWTMFPARYVVMVFAAFGPARYDARGWLWAASFLAASLLIYAGGAVWLARAAGSLRPATEELRVLVAEAAHVARVAPPPVYEQDFPRINAMALPLLGWVVFTSAAAQQLEPEALSAIAAHELGHLRESLAIKLARLGGGVAVFFAVGFVPAFPEAPSIGLIYGLGLFSILGGALRSLSRHLEQRADSVAREHEQHRGAYATALERGYQLNWAAAGVAGPAHPALYDRILQSGARPGYARPPAAAKNPRLLAFAFGLIGAVVLGSMVYPGLAMVCW